ncbi:DUF4864 domain-containing protein [Sulfitobacter sp. D35]|uniref:DUF4864 domain-containing protein n=1 Tax=Sulfitobacter sp. D35 TaxID=3083252 RepID=UPI00296F09F7|nr:DUF4864 domain-containing protein [Sulfitobacter sp. D35]MDW4498443.1 DUF4864 domain-containing protein [Sulfitobacter sp. D35]
MGRLLKAALFWLAMTVGAQAQDAEIRDTISQQFDAFRADDFARAFEFASPQLQLMFRTPDNFRAMVTQGYPMVWRPAEVRFLDLREEGGALWQRVMVTGENGSVHVLDYRMIPVGDDWRISGVQVLEKAGVAA